MNKEISTKPNTKSSSNKDISVEEFHERLGKLEVPEDKHPDVDLGEISLKALKRHNAESK